MIIKKLKKFWKFYKTKKLKDPSYILGTLIYLIIAIFLLQ